MELLQQQLLDQIILSLDVPPDNWEKVKEIVSKYRVNQIPDKDEAAAIFCEWMMGWLELGDKIKKMDNRELAWYFLQCPTLHQLPTGGLPDALCDEVLTRLYPEWDGEKITSTEWGWKTPDGDIVYDKIQYNKEFSGLRH